MFYFIKYHAESWSKMVGEGMFSVVYVAPRKDTLNEQCWPFLGYALLCDRGDFSHRVKNTDCYLKIDYTSI